MKYTDNIKPISYLKAHAAEISRSLNELREPMVITQNGEARMVVQDIKSYEQTQETLALLKILALGSQEVARGETLDATECVARLRRKDVAQ
ncbi:type II toxin-antitoxin system Phd/YefM family antitoxin [Franzmannia qiaohouensis]|uniref:Antitoxin n=1 Tax=Franzmannia qiaohouensis TaxID=1329370 RepID=A0ABU1HJ95_9GAMM|nr:type II toxin-antitoxin system Phd/YefM family antitoxin [Halomonas qiaohouensis]MDR5907547.1 type II toxin-antitoxin system Phd/YefM family antitoxin [Halomonas qiaohouensis]